MKDLLEGLLPRYFPGMSFMCIPHEGKSDLEKSIPRKLKAWRTPGDRFVVMRDQDQRDCIQLKQELLQMCVDADRPDTLVRIVCRELEAWYLGEPDALAEAFGNDRVRRIGNRARFRNPDEVQYPSTALKEIIPEFQKGSGARRMSRFLSRERNSSISFQFLLSGIERIWNEP